MVIDFSPISEWVFRFIDKQIFDHMADWAIALLTLMSILVSGMLAGLAYWNGLRATRIAKEAADREFEYRESEDARMAQARREEVALSMSRAVNAALFFSIEKKMGSPSVADSDNRARALLLEAITRISLFDDHEEGVILRGWFVNEVAQISVAESSKESGSEAPGAQGALLANIFAWSRGLIAAADLPSS